MDDQTESSRYTETSLREGSGLATRSGPVGIIDAPDPARGSQSDRGRLASYRQELDTENRRNIEFMAVFSHEIRNSLNGIRGAAQILRMQSHSVPAVLRASLLIERQVAHMTRFVDDLLDVSRMQSGHLCLQRRRIDLRTVMTNAVQSVEFDMLNRAHRMTTSLPDAPVWLQADATRLEQVFVNLLVNAAKYTNAGGDITLLVEQEADEAVVRICDKGIGIAPEMLPHIFGLYVQADPSSQRADIGLGIGLALVRSLVESHGGRVSAASAGIQHGSEFTVRLPISPEDDSERTFDRKESIG